MSTDTQQKQEVNHESAGLSKEPRYSFEISRVVLEVMSLFQSSDQTRLALNNTQFDIRRANGVAAELIMASTDGRRLAVHTQQISHDEIFAEFPEHETFCIDLDGVTKLPKVKSVRGKIVTVTVFEKHAEISTEKYKYRAKFYDGNYPAWRQVLPTDKPSPVASFPVSYKFIEDFGTAASKLCKDSNAIELMPHVYDDGSLGSIEVRLPAYSSFYGIVMPIKFDGEKQDREKQYDWVANLAKGETELGADRGSAK